MIDKHYKQYIQIGLNIMRCRKEQGLTQDELAEMTGYSRNHIQRVETAVSKPTVGLLLDVAEALHVPLERLLEPHPRGAAGDRPAIKAPGDAGNTAAPSRFPLPPAHGGGAGLEAQPKVTGGATKSCFQSVPSRHMVLELKDTVYGNGCPSTFGGQGVFFQLVM